MAAGGITMRKVGDWNKLALILDRAPGRSAFAMRQVVLQEAEFFRGQLVKNITSSGKLAGKPFEPNKPSTIASKGSNKPLIDSGALVQSVAVIERGRTVFVGVNRKTKGKQKRGKGGQFAKGFNMVDIAELHEFGKVINIRVTPAMLRFLHAKFAREGRGGGGGTGKLVVGGILVIRIPARPFIGPVIEMLYSNTGQFLARIATRFSVAMGGDLGRA